MTYTLKTFFDNADIKKGIVERIYPLNVFCLLCLYWIYSTERLCHLLTLADATPHEMVMVTGFYAIIVTSSLVGIYYETKDDVIDWLTGKINS